MKQLLYTAILVFTSSCIKAQRRDTVINERPYQLLEKSYFKTYGYAKFVVDYFYTEGISYGDRLSYEIIITDSLLMLGFSSPESDTYKYVSYQKKYLLTSQQLQTIKKNYLAARLKQKKPGIPLGYGSAHVREALIIKNGNSIIAGGTEYCNICYEERQKEINERKASSTLSGDYDGFIRYIKTLFRDLPALLDQSEQD